LNLVHEISLLQCVSQTWFTNSTQVRHQSLPVYKHVISVPFTIH